MAVKLCVLEVTAGVPESIDSLSAGKYLSNVTYLLMRIAYCSRTGSAVLRQQSWLQIDRYPIKPCFVLLVPYRRTDIEDDTTLRSIENMLVLTWYKFYHLMISNLTL